MDSSVTLFIDLFFSCCGLAYFMYGRKQRKMVPTLSGLVLMVYPYFVHNLTLLIIIGLVGAGLPWLIRE